MSDFEFNLTTTKDVKPPVGIIYGPAGTGKTTLAFNSPKTVFIQTEDGAGELELRTLKDGVFKSYDEVMAALRYIYANHSDLDVETVVIDTIDHLEFIVWDHVCSKNNWDSIEAPGYGKGYIECDKAWLDLINACIKLRDDKEIAVIALSHEIVRTANDPMNGPYDTHELKLHKRAVALWKEKSDFIGLLKNVVIVDSKTGKGKGGSMPTLHVRPSAAYTAKSRYKEMPSTIPIDIDNGWGDFSKYIPFYQNKT